MCMQEQWSKIQDIIRKSLEPGVFKVWIAPLSGHIDDSIVDVAAPTNHMAQRVRERFQDLIHNAATTVLGISYDKITVNINYQQSLHKGPKKPPVGLFNSGNHEELPLLYEASKQPFGFSRRPNNWRYSFEDYVVGQSNNLAVAAAHDVSNKSSYIETLFLSASSGLGKTHLVEALGNALCTKYKQCKVKCLTADEFTSGFIMALRSRGMDEFKASFRDINVLILEDIHLLQGRQKTQDEVLAIIKSMQAKGNRVVLTSSFSPKDLKNVDSQLVSHFCSGLLAHISKPTIEMRRDILNSKAKIHQVILPEVVADFLAEHVYDDVRQLESCIKNLIFKAKCLNRQISLELAAEIVAQYTQTQSIVDVATIVRLVCESYGLSLDQLTSRSRRHECVVARNTIYYLARKHTQLSLQDIGQKFNRRHSTVIKGISTLEREIKRESTIGRIVKNNLDLIERNVGLRT